MTPPSSPSRIGLGIWPEVTGPSSRRADPSRLERLLWHAVGAGAGWIDTAHVYDSGAGEAEIGRCLARMPKDSRPPVVTKGGIVVDRTAVRRAGTPVLEPLVLRAQLDASLRALGLEEVDTYLLHYPEEGDAPVEDAWAAVGAMATQGKAARIGLCAFGLDELRRCEAVRHVDVYLARLNPLDITSAMPILEWCAAHATEVVAWIPGDESRFMDPSISGPLAGTPYDHQRQKVDRMLSASVASEMTSLGAIYGLARRKELRIEDVIMAWTLAQPGVGAASVGATHGAQLDRWLAAAEARLSSAEIEQITASGRCALSGDGLLVSRHD